ncbi:MAG: substrate-binding domain-containing protein [Chloroflexi bacterium]|nr:substrate-binding domain-containing protein [Chloroflexota bacterium]
MNKLFFIVLLFLTSCATSASAKNILLVSTTSTQDSGLLDALLPAFEETSGYSVQLISTGSGQALKIAEEGNADVILLHSPSAEKEFMEQGFGIDRRLVMHNDFVIVGPASDPAGTKGLSPVSAFKKIHETQVPFISRSDESGTHIKELALWKAAALNPAGQPWYIETGQGQGATLSIANEKDGYAITDRGTFLAYQANIELKILVQNDKDLLNVYHVITVNPEQWPQVNVDGARAFADFITSAQGQEIIREFGVDKYGQPLFYPDADKTDLELGLP